jgi:hypothetical protein
LQPYGKSEGLSDAGFNPIQTSARNRLIGLRRTPTENAVIDIQGSALMYSIIGNRLTPVEG